MNYTLKKIALIIARVSLVLLAACNQTVPEAEAIVEKTQIACLLYTSPSPRD